MAKKNLRLFATKAGAGSLLCLLALAGCGRENVRFSEQKTEAISLEQTADQLGAKIDRIEQTFLSSKIEHAAVQLSMDSDRIEQKLTMKSAEFQQTMNYTQLSRPQLVDMFQQGSPGTSGTDNFTQNDEGNGGGVLDIMIVVDSSGSMSQEQANLSTKLNPLLSYVSNSDWRIAVNTTDPAAGCMRSIINKGDANYEQAFANAVTPGINGSGNERGILQAVNGLKGDCLSTPWLRPNSTVAVLIVSDEDNCSAGNDCGAQPYASGSYLTDYLASIRTVGTNARVYGLVWHASQTQAQCSTAAYKANIYSSVIDATSGTWGSICASDYSQTLASISQNISVILKSQFALTHAPVPGSANVTVNGQVVSSGYTITGNILQFATPPTQGATIAVSYLHSATEIKDKFVLSQSAHSSGISVMVDNNVASPSTYTFDSTQNAVVFATAPVGNNIRVTYKKNIDMLSQFAIGSGVVQGSVKAFVNNSPVSNFSVDYNTGNVNFASAPAEAASIKLTFAKIGGAILSYPLVIAGAAESLEVTDDATGNAVAHSIEGNNVIFPVAEFQHGRIVQLAHTNVSGSSHIVVLTAAPKGGSIRVSAPGGDCNNFSVSGLQVNLEACGYTSDTEVKIEFDYVTGKTLSFEVAEAAVLTKEIKQEWKVWVADEASSDFKRSGNTITFTSLPDAVEVKVEVRFINQ